MAEDTPSTTSVQRKSVLDVGQCQPDHAALTRAIKSRFQADVEYCDGIQSALEHLSERSYDLVLVNRVIDGTHDEGLELVRRMKASPYLGDIPVMMVSNFESAQKEAMQLGAVRGFGKADLDEDSMRRALAPFLT